jgi:hypothetical protein
MPTTTTTARRVRLVASLIILLALSYASTVLAQRAVPAYRITALKAMLFYGQSGMFSADLFGPTAPTLQNVSTGEGQSTATLVVVEITGQPDSYAPTRKISLRATAEGRVLLSRTASLGRPGDDGKFYSAFWVYDTGCIPVILNARLVGQSPESSIQKTISFKCGE